jgi:hypothetical protein
MGTGAFGRGKVRLFFPHAARQTTCLGKLQLSPPAGGFAFWVGEFGFLADDRDDGFQQGLRIGTATNASSEVEVFQDDFLTNARGQC